MKKESLRLVIDTCIAKSAGKTEHPVSSSCRKVLITILVACHRLVFTKKIAEEWNKHKSIYTTTWLNSMNSKKKVEWIEPSKKNQKVKDLHNKINNSNIEGGDRKALDKDLFLVIAAMNTDKIIISNDNELNNILKEIKIIPEFINKFIIPVDACDEFIKWLNDKSIKNCSLKNRV